MHWEVYGDFIKVAEPRMSFSLLCIICDFFLLRSLNRHFIVFLRSFQSFADVVLTGAVGLIIVLWGCSCIIIY